MTDEEKIAYWMHESTVAKVEKEQHKIADAASILGIVIVACTMMLCYTLFKAAEIIRPQVSYTIGEYQLEKGG